MEKLSDQPVSVEERAKIRRFMKLYMARYGREVGELLSCNAMGERVNKYIERTYGSDPDGNRFLSRNAIENFLEMKTHTPDLKIQGIKAFLLSIKGFVSPEQFEAHDPIDGAALAMCDFYGLEEPKSAGTGTEELYLFTSADAGRKFILEFSLGSDYERPANAVYTRVRGTCSGEWKGGIGGEGGIPEFGPIPCDGFGILSFGMLYLFLRAGVRRTPLFFTGKNPSEISVAAWVASAEPRSDLFQSLPSVYQGSYKGTD